MNKLCINCKYCLTTYYADKNLLEYTCTHAKALSPVDGKSNFPCKFCRTYDHKCSVEGKWFELKESNE